MHRIAPVVLAALILLAGCKKSTPANTGKPNDRPKGGQTFPKGGTEKPPDNPNDNVDNQGWIPTAVPAKQKEVPWETILKVIKVKDQLVVEDQRKILMRNEDMAVSDMKAVDKIITRIGDKAVLEELMKLPDDSHRFIKVKSTRVWEKRFKAPAGFSDEKHEYALMSVTIVWNEDANDHFNDISSLEDEIQEVYFLICTENLRDVADRVVKLRARARELGYGANEMQYDPQALPFEDMGAAVTRILALMDLTDKKTGDLAEASAWLKLGLEWNHFPPNPAAGEANVENTKLAEQKRLGKARQADSSVSARLRTGDIKIDPADAKKALEATNITLAHKLANFAGEAGKGLLAWELSIAIFASKEDDEFKRTRLSALKLAATSGAGLFNEFDDAFAAQAPGELLDSVRAFTKGNPMATRNAVSVLEALKKAKPATAAKVDEAIAELKKK